MRLLEAVGHLRGPTVGELKRFLWDQADFPCMPLYTYGCTNLLVAFHDTGIWASFTRPRHEALHTRPQVNRSTTQEACKDT